MKCRCMQKVMFLGSSIMWVKSSRNMALYMSSMSSSRSRTSAPACASRRMKASSASDSIASTPRPMRLIEAIVP